MTLLVPVKVHTVFGEKNANYDPQTQLFHVNNGASYRWDVVLRVIEGDIRRPRQH